jgi:hypothetical protein
MQAFSPMADGMIGRIKSSLYHQSTQVSAWFNYDGISHFLQVGTRGKLLAWHHASMERAPGQSGRFVGW